MTMDYDAVPQQVWNHASQTSRPLGSWPLPTDLTVIFERSILSPRGPVDPDIIQAMAMHRQIFGPAPHADQSTPAPRPQQPYLQAVRSLEPRLSHDLGI